MLSLRCIHLCDQWNEFTSFRVQQETERLYPYRDALHETAWALAT